MDESAVNHVYELKNRPRDKAMNLNVSSYEDILSYSKEQPDYLKKIYDAFLPGPFDYHFKRLMIKSPDGLILVWRQLAFVCQTILSLEN